MNSIFTDFDSAVKATARQMKLCKPSKICLTGGKFGRHFLKELDVINYSATLEDFYITDERLCDDKEQQNAVSILTGLKRLKNFEPSRFVPFLQAEDPILTYKIIDEKLCKYNFDYAVLSLGEDGHLAGHFENSNLLNDNRFCFTSEALKKPKTRISFSIDFLKKSKKIVLAIYGEKKKQAITKLLNGNGLHSSILKNKNLTIYTDLTHIL